MILKREASNQNKIADVVQRSTIMAHNGVQVYHESFFCEINEVVNHATLTLLLTFLLICRDNNDIQIFKKKFFFNFALFRKN